MKNPNANVVRAKRTNKANVPADLRSSVSVVRVVKVVIEVKAKCKRSACEKNQQD